MDKNHSKKILKVAIGIYLLSFLIINWNDVSWIFNYRALYGIISDFFNPYPSIAASELTPYFYPNHSQQQTNLANLQNQNLSLAQEIKTIYTDKQNTIEIPQIGLVMPIFFSANTEKTTIMNDLNNGVVYYPGSVYPGQPGQIVILGHSAPPGWPRIKNDWAFSDLEKLKEGDAVYIDLNNKQYKYIVRQKTIIKRGAEVPSPSDLSKSNLTLISCWPPGKDYQRIAVQAEIQDNY